MDTQEWRGRFKRGDAWRSTTAETCGICGCRSNLWEMGGYPGMGPRLICPGRRKYPQLHEELLRKKLSVSDNGHYGRDYLPRSVIKELQEERDKARSGKIQKGQAQRCAATTFASTVTGFTHMSTAVSK